MWGRQQGSLRGYYISGLHSNFAQVGIKLLISWQKARSHMTGLGVDSEGTATLE
jgi:hypothetical protein